MHFFFRGKKNFTLYKMESKQNYHRKALPLGLQSEEIDTNGGTPASIERRKGIKCELGKT